MKLKIVVVDFEIPSRVKRWALRIGISVIVLGFAAVALAGTPLHTWSTNDILQATDLNGNFTSIQGQIAAIQPQISLGKFVVTLNNVSYSTGATTYCGTGPVSTTGAISYSGKTGYVGAKTMCQASAGCSSSLSAHMCTTEELARSAQAGIAIPAGWYSGAIYAVGGISPQVETWDCQGWTSTNGNWVGPQWSDSPSAPNVAGCASATLVLCCD